MLEALDFEKELADMTKKYERNYALLEERRDIVVQATELAQQFDSEERNLSVTTAVGIHTHETTTIDFRLKKGQHIEDVKPLLKLIAQTRLFHPATETDYLDMGWVGWKFRQKDKALTLMVRVWFGESQVCRLEPTGEMEPVMKVVCEPSVTFDQPRSEA